MRKLITRRAGLGLGLAMAVGLAAYPLTNRTAQAEERHHPRIHAAIEALVQAKAEVEEAKHEWGGEKKEAVESIDRAIEHLKRLDGFHE